MLIVSVLGIVVDQYIVSYYNKVPLGLVLLAAVLFFVSASVAMCTLVPSWFRPEVHGFFVRAFWIALFALGIGALLTIGTAVLASTSTC